MGSFLFKWEHPAKEVYVTGTFDDWARSVKLDNKGSCFEKVVELPLANKKIYYKFVVDGTWTTDHTAPQEKDGANNVNNVLLPENITGPHSTSGPAAAGIMSGVTPQSTTAGLASNVAKEGEKDLRPESAASDVPGSFPETPFHDAEEFAVAPIPASSGIGNPVNLAPGEGVPHPNTLTSNTIQSTVRDDPSLKKGKEGSEQGFGVAPLPATSGTGNPISLQPGEKVPHPSSFTENTINSNVTTDKDSYDKAGGTPQLPNVITPPNEREAKGGMFSMPEASGTMIPESSLPMGEGAARDADPVTIQSAGANSSTAAMAGQVPLEPRGKAQVIPESGGASSGATNEAAASSKGVPSSVQQSIDEMNKGSAIAPTVPDPVQESITEAHVSPEAAGNETVVREKTAMEKELLKEIPQEDDVGAPAPSSTAALAEGAPAPTSSENPPPTPAKDIAPVTTAAAPAEPPAAKNATKQAVAEQPDSRDISPMSKPLNAQSLPAVTSGVGASSAPTTSSAGKGVVSSSSAVTDKKSKRSSGFFGKLKSKFSDKDKK